MENSNPSIGIGIPQAVSFDLDINFGIGKLYLLI
jgi:hypothetical protein